MSAASKRIIFGIFLLVCAVSVPSVDAQAKNEVALVIGATVSPDISLANPPAPPGATNFSFQSSLALGAEYDRRLFSTKHVAVYGGGDFLASPLDVKLNNPPSSLSNQYAYIFLTPHIRAKFDAGAIEPWLLIGGGYARFLEAAPKTVPPGGFSPGTNTGTLEVGGGFDTKTVFHVLFIPIGFRAEVRDFYSGAPRFGVPITQDKQHTVAFTGGLHLRF